MVQFIKVELTGLGWGVSGHGDIHDYKKFSNLVSDFFRHIAPFDGSFKEGRTVVVSVCEQLDRVHIIESDEKLIIPI